MKRVIHSSDWEVQGNPKVDAFKEAMMENFDTQDEPEVGIFWYSPRENELFGVRSAGVDDVAFFKSSLFSNRVKTCRPLHSSVWKRESRTNRKFQGDYTQVPRGRVFYVENEGFVVMVGSWINDYPQCKDLVLNTFNLPDDTSFEIDSHWELGHGWSDEF